MEYAKAKQIKTDGGTTVEAELATKASTAALTGKQDILPADSLGLINKTAGSSKFLREDGTWQTVSGGGTGDVEEAPTDGKLYGRKDASWEEISGSSLTELPLQAYDELNLVTHGQNISTYPVLSSLDYGYHFARAGFLYKRKIGGYDNYTYHQLGDRVYLAFFDVNVTRGGSITVYHNYGAGGKEIAFIPPMDGKLYGMRNGVWEEII